MLHRMAQAESQPQRIAVAIVWLRRHLHEAFRIDDLAWQAGMSTSSFHQRFHEKTGMSRCSIKSNFVSKKPGAS